MHGAWPLAALASALAAAALAVEPAAAQPPGRTPPLGTSTSEFHATPPLPRVLPSPMPGLPPPRARGAQVDPLASGGWSVSTGAAGWSAQVGPDGRIQFDGRALGAGAGVDPVLGLLAWLQFDSTDAAMRAARQDPYLAAKLRLMDESRAERMRMRAAHDEEVMARAIDDLPAYLAAVWSVQAWSPAERRRVLFALWDEAAEDGNELLRAGGAAARATIERFIAARLPPGSRHAYRADELAALNRLRTSRAPFAPYRRAAADDATAAAPAAAAPAAAAPAPAPAAVAAALRGF